MFDEPLRGRATELDGRTPTGQSPETAAGDDAASDAEAAPEAIRETTVTVRCTGHVRTELGRSEFEYAFAGDTLRAFLDELFDDELFDDYPGLQDMLIAETEADTTHSG